MSFSELTLPTFSKSHKQNALLFLREIDGYFKERRVPKSLNLPLALRSVTDEFAKEWLLAIAHDLQSYEQFKQAFTKQFWNEHMMSKTRCAIYTEKYDRRMDEFMAAHFLKYAVQANVKVRLGNAEIYAILDFGSQN
jgi:hypothetical protein